MAKKEPEYQLNKEKLIKTWKWYLVSDNPIRIIVPLLLLVGVLSILSSVQKARYMSEQGASSSSKPAIAPAIQPASPLPIESPATTVPPSPVESPAAIATPSPSPLPMEFTGDVVKRGLDFQWEAPASVRQQGDQILVEVTNREQCDNGNMFVQHWKVTFDLTTNIWNDETRVASNCLGRTLPGQDEWIQYTHTDDNQPFNVEQNGNQTVIVADAVEEDGSQVIVQGAYEITVEGLVIN